MEAAPQAVEPSARPTRRTLVIGYGSPIRGDDAIGPLVADRLERAGLPAGVNVLSRHILTADLVADLCAADLVIFVDASVDGVPGEIQCQRLAPERGTSVTVAHFLDPRELLAWADTLYGHRPAAFLVSTPGHCFDFGHFQLSEPVAATVEGLVARVRELIADPIWIDGQRVVPNTFGDGSITS